ncbi:MAG: 5'/3'-nucleotidase SurE [Clostridia bacterium]|nr:5'/3'-nucleotidase SurE [Clostridia bacterium]
MNILIANDDGVFKKGIKVLCECLASMEGVHVYVCGPDRERTCSGHGLVLTEPVEIKEFDKTDYPHAEMVWSCSGTPADCVRMGIGMMMELGAYPDLVCTGINHGPNIGRDVHYSGTVAAAMEAIFKGIPAIAFSLCSHDCTHFEHFEKLVPMLVEKTYGKIPTSLFLNVNVPDLPDEKIMGIKIAELGPRDYTYKFTRVSGSREDGLCIIESEDVIPPDASPEWDLTAWKEGWITVTPIQMMTHNSEYMELLKAQNFNIV